jgi:hypothetical protein
MASWITTKQLLRRQDAKSLHTRNRENDVLGHPTGNMDIIWAPQCITTAVKMYTSRLRLANASWIHSSFSLTIIRCHNFLPLPDCSWRPTTCQMHYKTLIRRYPSPTSGMTPSQRSQHWGKFSNSNSNTFTFPNFQLPPAKVTQRTCLAESSNQILASTMPPPRQTRSQTTIHAREITNAPLLPRVVTPMTRQHSPPRMPRRSQNLAPRNLSQDDFCGMSTDHIAISLGNHHWSQKHQANAVVHPITGKEMEYMALMKYPRLQPLWTRGFGNEVGRLFQGIQDITGTETCFFVKFTNIPKNRQITDGKIICDYKPHKKEKERVRLTVGGDRLYYSSDVATSTADITTFKILINSTLSTADAAMMMMDIKTTTWALLYNDLNT